MARAAGPTIPRRPYATVFCVGVYGAEYEVDVEGFGHDLVLVSLEDRIRIAADEADDSILLGDPSKVVF